jgi:pimeloyl-ACP methyl ester carboxylesterase
MRLLTRAQPAIKLMLRASGFRLHTFETRSARLRYLEYSSGTGGGPIVFLHGIGSSAAANGKVLGALRASSRRIIALDAPGHGFSDAPRDPLTPELFFDCVAEALDALITEPALIVGNSLGGAVALRYAGLRPKNVRGVVATSPGGAPPVANTARVDARENAPPANASAANARAANEPTANELGANAPATSKPAANELGANAPAANAPAANAIDELVTRFDLSTPGAARAFINRLYHQPPWYAPLLAGDVQYIISRPAIRQFLSALSPKSFFTPEELRALQMPILLIWGRSDKLLSQSDLAYFRRHLPASAQIEEPEHFGHSPQFEWPLELAERIARFNQELDARDASLSA